MMTGGCFDEVTTNEYRWKGGLLEALKEVPDPRTRKGDYELQNLLASVFLGIADGCVFVNQIPLWLSSLHFSQRRRLGFKETIPDESTFRRILRTIDADKFNSTLKPWFEEKEIREKVIALDGKRLCGAHNSGERPAEILNIGFCRIWNMKREDRELPLTVLAV